MPELNAALLRRKLRDVRQEVQDRVRDNDRNRATEERPRPRQ
jgi:hypothetical protein